MDNGREGAGGELLLIFILEAGPLQVLTALCVRLPIKSIILYIDLDQLPG